MNLLRRLPSHTLAILLAILVTILWSTSWILIKVGLSPNLPALTFAGLRYVTAFVCLAPFVLASRQAREQIANLARPEWIWLAAYGLVVYTLTQGAQFLSLAYLPANMVSLILNMSSVFIAAAGMYFLKERPALSQWIGILLAVAGAGVYFLPVAIPPGQAAGLGFAVLCMAANVAAALFGRRINHHSPLSPLVVTFVSMGTGSLLLLAAGLLGQGVGRLAWSDWAIIAWLAVVNTALAFTLWNLTLRTLTAVESGVINSLMMPQIALLAYFFLGEVPSGRQLAGLILVGVGVLVVQLRGRITR